MNQEIKVDIFQHGASGEFPEEFLTTLREGWTRAARILQEIGIGEITHLSEIEISLCDDEMMARVHGEFLNDTTTTDVITFEHGELLIGVEVAAKQSVSYDVTPDREIALYGIHGMLHLAGFDDREAAAAKLMAERQEELLQECFPTFCVG